MNEQPLTIQQAATLTEHSKVDVWKAIRDQRWPSYIDERGQTMVSPAVLVHHWARDLADPSIGARTRELLTNLAEGADYPLDLDALERAAVRHLQIEHELEMQRKGQRTVELEAKRREEES